MLPIVKNLTSQTHLTKKGSNLFKKWRILLFAKVYNKITNNY